MVQCHGDEEVEEVVDGGDEASVDEDPAGFADSGVGGGAGWEEGRVGDIVGERIGERRCRRI